MLLNAVSFSVEFDRFLTEIIVNLAPIPGDAAVFPLVPSLLLLIFVIVMEGWIWYKRLITTISFSVADRFGKSYVISPISNRSAR